MREQQGNEYANKVEKKTTRFLPRAEHRSQEDVELPALATKRLVDASRNIAGRCAETHEQDEGARHQRASVGGRQKAEAGEYQSDHRHDEHLDTGADKDREHHAFPGRPEYVAVHELPAKLFLGILSRIDL